MGDQRPAAAGWFALSINVDGAATTQNATTAGPPAAPGWAARTERGTLAAPPALSRPSFDWRTSPPSTTASGTSADPCARRGPAGPDAPPNEWAISGRRPLACDRSIDVDGAATAQNATAAGPPAAPGWAARTGRGTPADAPTDRDPPPTGGPPRRARPPAGRAPRPVRDAGLPDRTRRPTIWRSAAGGRCGCPEYKCRRRCDDSERYRRRSACSAGLGGAAGTGRGLFRTERQRPSHWRRPPPARSWDRRPSRPQEPSRAAT